MVLRELGDDAGACEQLELLVAAEEGFLPEDHEGLFERRIVLFTMLVSLGEYRRARPHVEAVHATELRTLTVDDPDLFDTWVTLLETLVAVWDHEAFYAELDACLAAVDRLAPDDERAAWIRSDICVVVGSLETPEAYERTHDLALDTLAAFERLYPDDHYYVLKARSNLATTLAATGDPAEAAALQASIIEDRERSFPEDHEMLLLMRMSLAGSLLDLGEHERVRELVLATAEGLDAAPANDLEALQVRVELAKLLLEIGELERGHALMEDTLENCERVLPESSLETADLRMTLAGVLSDMRNWLGERALREAAEATYARNLPYDHPRRNLNRWRLGITLVELEQKEEACRVIEDTLSAYEGRPPADEQRIPSVKFVLATLLSGLGDLAGARALFEDIRPGATGDSLDLGPEKNLALTIYQMGDREEGRARLEAVVEDYESRPDTLVTARLELVALTMGTDRESASALLRETLSELAPDDPRRLELENRFSSLFSDAELEGWLTRQELWIAGLERELEGHSKDLLETRARFAEMLLLADLPERAREQGRKLARGVIRRLEEAALGSPRRARATARSHRWQQGLIRLLTRTPEGEADPLCFELAETMRAVSAVSAAGIGPSSPRKREIAELRIRLNDLVTGGPREGQSVESFVAELSRLTRERDRLERLLRSELAGEGGATGSVRAADLARSLPEGAAAVGFLRHTPQVVDRDLWGDP